MGVCGFHRNAKQDMRSKHFKMSYTLVIIVTLIRLFKLVCK